MINNINDRANKRVNEAYSNNLGLINQNKGSFSRVYNALTTNGKMNYIDNIIIYDKNGNQYQIGKYFEGYIEKYTFTRDIYNIVVDNIARRNALKLDRKENFIYKTTLYLYDGQGVSIKEVIKNHLDFTTDTHQHFKDYVVLEFKNPCNMCFTKEDIREFTQAKFYISGSSNQVETNFGKKVAQLKEELKKDNIKIDAYTLEKLLKLYEVKKIIKEVL